jgi:hypothetical protein
MVGGSNASSNVFPLGIVLGLVAAGSGGAGIALRSGVGFLMDAGKLWMLSPIDGRVSGGW